MQRQKIKQITLGKGDWMKQNISLLCVSTFLLANAAVAVNRPLKVFILVGQSNMEGQANIRVLDYMGEDPETAPLLAEIKDADGSHRMIQNTWISFLTGLGGGIDGENREVYGQLTTGYGTQGGRDYSKPGHAIGPELGFGITMQNALKEPILIIKAAWGGKSLNKDFRPPNSGPYVPTAEDIERKKYETEEQRQELKEATGVNYRVTVNHAKAIIKDIKRVYPDYDPKQGYKLAGCVWFQGWNDMVDRGYYPRVPEEHSTPRFVKYTELMANFIRDIRNDLAAPQMPFVVGVMGVGGVNPNPDTMDFRMCQAAVAEMPEFKGNVLAVPTAPYWDEALAELDKKNDQIRQKGYLLRTKHPENENTDGKMTPEEIEQFLVRYRKELYSEEDIALEKRAKSNAGYHYLGSAKTFCQMGKAFAEGILELRHEGN